MQKYATKFFKNFSLQFFPLKNKIQKLVNAINYEKWQKKLQMANVAIEISLS